MIYNNYGVTNKTLKNRVVKPKIKVSLSLSVNCLIIIIAKKKILSRASHPAFSFTHNMIKLV